MEASLGYTVITLLLVGDTENSTLTLLPQTVAGHSLHPCLTKPLYNSCPEDGWCSLFPTSGKPVTALAEKAVSLLLNYLPLSDLITFDD